MRKDLWALFLDCTCFLGADWLRRQNPITMWGVKDEMRSSGRVVPSGKRGRGAGERVEQYLLKLSTAH